MPNACFGGWNGAWRASKFGMARAIALAAVLALLALSSAYAATVVTVDMKLYPGTGCSSASVYDASYENGTCAPLGDYYSNVSCSEFGNPSGYICDSTGCSGTCSPVEGNVGSFGSQYCYQVDPSFAVGFTCNQTITPEYV